MDKLRGQIFEGVGITLSSDHHKTPIFTHQYIFDRIPECIHETFVRFVQVELFNWFYLLVAETELYQIFVSTMIYFR